MPWDMSPPTQSIAIYTIHFFPISPGNTVFNIPVPAVASNHIIRQIVNCFLFYLFNLTTTTCSYTYDDPTIPCTASLGPGREKKPKNSCFSHTQSSVRRMSHPSASSEQGSSSVLEPDLETYRQRSAKGGAICTPNFLLTLDHLIMLPTREVCLALVTPPRLYFLPEEKLA